MDKATYVLDCVQLVIALLVCPPALATLVVITYRSIKKQQFIEALPLILCQMNTVFIWSCATAYQIENFYFYTTGH